MAKKKHKHRNASHATRSAASPPVHRRGVKPPTLEESLAWLVGGGGGAFTGALLQRWGLSPGLTAGAMIAGGLVGGQTTDGSTRLAFQGLAAAGAGQLALTVLANRAEKAAEEKAKQLAEKAKQAAPAQPQLSNAAGQVEQVAGWAERYADGRADEAGGWEEDAYSN